MKDHRFDLAVSQLHHHERSVVAHETKYIKQLIHEIRWAQYLHLVGKYVLATRTLCFGPTRPWLLVFRVSTALPTYVVWGEQRSRAILGYLPISKSRSMFYVYSACSVSPVLLFMFVWCLPGRRSHNTSADVIDLFIRDEYTPALEEVRDLNS